MEYRAVSVETLREFARDRAELTSVRQVAAEVGLGRTTLHNFISGDTTPHPRVRRLLALWYLREKDKQQKGFAPADFASALAILLDELPAEQRAEATATLVDRIAALYASVGVAIPPGLAALRQGDPDPQS